MQGTRRGNVDVHQADKEGEAGDEGADEDILDCDRFVGWKDRFVVVIDVDRAYICELLDVVVGALNGQGEAEDEGEGGQGEDENVHTECVGGMARCVVRDGLAGWGDGEGHGRVRWLGSFFRRM